MKMKKRFSPGLAMLLSALLLMALMAAGCGGKGGGDTAWQYERPIKEALKATSAEQDTTIGDLSTHGVAIAIPGKSFDAASEVSLVNPEQVPKVTGAEFTPMGAPIQLSAGEKGVRLKHPVTVTLKIDKDKLGSEKEAKHLQAAYFNGKKWEYIKPSKIDPVAGTLTLTTYHFSLFGYGKVSVEQQIKQYTHSKALADAVQSNVDDKVDNVAEQVIGHILKGPPED